MKVTAVIPIRAGSQRVPNKNLRPFANSNLLEIKINVLKQTKIIDEIVVNTDSDQAIEVAIKNGINYHRREPYYASSACSGADFFQNLGRTTKSDFFVYAPVTAPFIKPQLYDECVNLLLDQTKYDSVATVSLVKDHLWLNGQPLNYELTSHPNSQDLPDIHALNFGVCVIKNKTLIDLKSVVGKKPLFIELSEVEGIDIDTPLDFFTAEQVYKRLIISESSLLH